MRPALWRGEVVVVVVEDVRVEVKEGDLVDGRRRRGERRRRK